MQFPIRINKYLRDRGLATRKEADRLIASGLVFVNGKRAELGRLVNQTDKVALSQAAKTRQYVYKAYYKPRGLPTQEMKGVKSVITEWQDKGLFPVGRLDKESEGLLILTNDGRITSKVLGQDSNIEKEYQVKVREILKGNLAAIFAKGMETETFGKLLPAEAHLLDDHNLRVVLQEGKKHQIRVMLSELGYTVVSLKRVRIGLVVLGRMRVGETRDLEKREIEGLLRV